MNSCRLLLLSFTLIISGCTSALAVGTAYDAAIGQFRKTLLGYADFNVAQEKQIKTRIAAFHQWHRSSQLPKYQTLLTQISDSLNTPSQVTRDEIKNWSESFSGLTTELSTCSPVNQSGRFLRNLTDRQVRQINKEIRDRHIERVSEYQSQTPLQRRNERRKTIEKWAGRAGLKLNEAQKSLIKTTLQNQISLSPQRQALWQQWSDRFVEKLHRRNNDTFTAEVNQHIEALWTLTSRNYPAEWQQSVTLWEDFTFEFIQLMDETQVTTLTKKIDSLAAALEKIYSKPAKADAICFAATQ